MILLASAVQWVRLLFLSDWIASKEIVFHRKEGRNLFDVLERTGENRSQLFAGHFSPSPNSFLLARHAHSQFGPPHFLCCLFLLVKRRLLVVGFTQNFCKSAGSNFFANPSWRKYTYILYSLPKGGSSLLRCPFIVLVAEHACAPCSVHASKSDSRGITGTRLKDGGERKKTSQCRSHSMIRSEYSPHI